MPLDMEVGLGQATLCYMGMQLPPKGQTPTLFLAHVYCGQMAGWINVPLGTEVDLAQATLC